MSEETTAQTQTADDATVTTDKAAGQSGKDGGKKRASVDADGNKIYYQSDMDTNIESAKKTAREDAIKDVASQLGVTLKEAKEIIAERNKKIEAEKTFEQKHTEAQARIQALEKEKQQIALNRELDVLLLAGGATSETLQKARKLVDTSGITFDENGNPTGHAEAVKAVIEDKTLSSLFTGTKKPIPGMDLNLGGGGSITKQALMKMSVQENTAVRERIGADEYSRIMSGN